MNEIQFIFYQLPDEEGRVQVVIKDDMGYAEGDGTVVWCGGACYQHGAIEGKTQTNETVTICNQLEYYCVNSIPAFCAP